MKKFNGEVKKLKLWKKVLIAISIILLILFLIVLYRFLILTKINTLQKRANKISNVYYVRTQEDFSPQEVWIKDNKVKVSHKNEKNGYVSVWWKDLNTGESIDTLDYENGKKYYKENTNLAESFTCLTQGVYSQEYIRVRFLDAIDPDNKIGITEYNGKKCYVKKTKDKIRGYQREEIYDKETGLILYDSAASTEVNEKTNQWVNKSLKYEYKLNTVTDEDVAKPDVTGYELIKREQK